DVRVAIVNSSHLRCVNFETRGAETLLSEFRGQRQSDIAEPNNSDVRGFTVNKVDYFRFDHGYVQSIAVASIRMGAIIPRANKKQVIKPKLATGWCQGSVILSIKHV